MCLPLCPCVRVQWCPQRPEECVDRLELELQGVVGCSMWMWKPKSPLQEQYIFLTTAPSLQPQQVALLTDLQMLLMQLLDWNNSVGGKKQRHCLQEDH